MPEIRASAAPCHSIVSSAHALQSADRSVVLSLNATGACAGVSCDVCSFVPTSASVDVLEPSRGHSSRVILAAAGLNSAYWS